MKVARTIGSGSASLSRRNLLAAGAPLFVPASALGLAGAVPPSDRINVAGLGIGGRGERDLESFLAQDDVQFRAICDARNERREAIKSKVDKHHGNSDCEMYADMHDLWERRDIDAVLIATGDRWHTLLSILTAQSGKDVYCEKPCSMTIAESRGLADAFHRLGRVYQAGTQRRNGTNFEHCIALAREGKLGELRSLHANAAPGQRYTPLTTHDWLPAEPEPPKSVVDWGPLARSRALAPVQLPIRQEPLERILRLPRRRDPRMGLAHGRPLPRSGGSRRDGAGAFRASPSGGGHARTRWTSGTPTAWNSCFATRAGKAWAPAPCDSTARRAGSRPETPASWRHPDSLRQHRKTFEDAREATTRHVRDFLNCVKTRDEPRANALAACQTHVACHAAYIAYQLGEPLDFDPATDTFPSNEQANRMRSRAMREPWRLA